VCPWFRYSHRIECFHYSWNYVFPRTSDGAKEKKAGRIERAEKRFRTRFLAWIGYVLAKSLRWHDPRDDEFKRAVLVVGSKTLFLFRVKATVIFRLENWDWSGLSLTDRFDLNQNNSLVRNCRRMEAILQRTSPSLNKVQLGTKLFLSLYDAFQLSYAPLCEVTIPIGRYRDLGNERFRLISRRSRWNLII